MPMTTTHTAVDAAWSAATTFVHARVAERRLLAILPDPDHPDRAVLEASIADVGRIARRAFRRYHRRLRGLLDAGLVLQAGRIAVEVEDRIVAARTPVPIPVSEEARP